jgi:hypothetical protein
MWTTLRVTEKTDLDVTISQIEDGLRTVSREPCELQEKSELYAVAAMSELFLCCADGGLYDLCQVLNIHRRLVSSFD